MSRMRSMALPALLALGGLGLWGSSAAAQYVGGRTTYAAGYYYSPGQGDYGSGYSYSPRPAADLSYYPSPAPYYVAPAPSFRSWVVVPGGSSGRNYPARFSGRSVPSHNFGLEPESLPAQIAENVAPAPVAPGLGTTWRTGWWPGRTSKRISGNW